jgi:threonine aldolase
MRAAMANADVGDDVYGEDPTVAHLEARIAGLLGKESALFVPSGTMGNQLAIALHTRPGDEVICGAMAHPVLYECGAAAALSGVSLAETREPFFGATELAARVQPSAYYMPRTRVVSFENTHNRAGGRVWPAALLDESVREARRQGLATHLDGARLWNAVAATGTTAEHLAQGMDSVTVCLSKGLGAPVGSVLAGTKPFVAGARRLRKMWGGGMRQVGVLAAAGIYALDHEWPRLAEDHRRARAFAEALVGAAGFAIDVEAVETNIVNVGFTPKTDVRVAVESLREARVWVSSLGPGQMRVVLHRDIDDDALAWAIESFRAVGESYAGAVS